MLCTLCGLAWSKENTRVTATRVRSVSIVSPSRVIFSEIWASCWLATSIRIRPGTFAGNMRSPRISSALSSSAINASDGSFSGASMVTCLPVRMLRS